MEQQINAHHHECDTAKNEQLAVQATPISPPLPLQPPPQPPSTKVNNILELNDDCLIEIFSRFPILYLCNVRKVCQRFKMLVDYAFVRKYNHTIDLSQFIHYDEYQITLLFKSFGTLIRQLIIKWPTNSILYQKLMNLYCPNIEELKLIFVDMTPNNLWITTFKRLHSLSIIECRANGTSIYRLLQRCPNLTHFKLKCSIKNIHVRTNGMKTIRYATYEYSGDPVRDKLDAFLGLHPRLDTFDLYTPPNMATCAMERICFTWNRTE